MLILSLDSASSGCRVCLFSNEQVLSFHEEIMARGQDARLVPIIRQCLEETGNSFSDLDRIAVIKGPGSFTGLRLGLAAARGFGLALEKPVIGINRFDLYRAQYATQNPLLIAVDSKREALFVRIWNDAGQPLPDQQMTPAEIQQFHQENPQAVLVGDGGSLSQLVLLPAKESEVITAARLAATADPKDPLFAPSPVYLRDADVTLGAACQK